jgi:hypothetical protein
MTNLIDRDETIKALIEVKESMFQHGNPLTPACNKNSIIRIAIETSIDRINSLTIQQ